MGHSGCTVWLCILCQIRGSRLWPVGKLLPHLSSHPIHVDLALLLRVAFVGLTKVTRVVEVNY